MPAETGWAAAGVVVVNVGIDTTLAFVNETLTAAPAIKAGSLTVAAGSRMRGHVEFGWNSVEPKKFVNGEVREQHKNGEINAPDSTAAAMESAKHS